MLLTKAGYCSRLYSIVIKLTLIFVFYCLFQVSSEGEILTYECEELDITTQAVDDEDKENDGKSEWEK